jgi:hypothetical protein
LIPSDILSQYRLLARLDVLREFFGRWCPRTERQLRLMLLQRRALQVRQDLRDNFWLLNAGDDPELAAAGIRGRLLRRPRPRCAGVTAARSLLCGANTPWKRVRCMRGGGTSAARRAIRSSGSSTMWVVPSRYGVFSV